MAATSERKKDTLFCLKSFNYSLNFLSNAEWQCCFKFLLILIGREFEYLSCHYYFINYTEEGYLLCPLLTTALVIPKIHFGDFIWYPDQLNHFQAMVLGKSNTSQEDIWEMLGVSLVVIIIWGARNIRCHAKHNEEMSHVTLKYPAGLNLL